MDSVISRSLKLAVNWLQESCILFCILIVDPDPFGLAVGGRRRLFSYTRTMLQLFQDTITYSRLPFSCRLPFRSITDYLTHGNTLIYLYLDLQSKYNHLSLYLFLDPSCATDIS
jgi:hypothetical protein